MKWSWVFGLWSLSVQLSSSEDVTLRLLQKTKIKYQRPKTKGQRPKTKGQKTISFFEGNMHLSRCTAIYCIAKILGLLS